MILRRILTVLVVILLLAQTAAIVGMWIAWGPQPPPDIADIAEQACQNYATSLGEASDEVIKRLETGIERKQAVADFAAMNASARDVAFQPISDTLNKIPDDEVSSLGYIEAWRQLSIGFKEAGK